LCNGMEMSIILRGMMDSAHLMFVMAGLVPAIHVLLGK